MALPTRDDILTTKFSADGSPFVKIAAKSTVELDSLQFSKDGSPWWGFELSGVVGNIKKIGGIIWASAKKINMVVLANIKKLAGITT